MPFSSLIHRLSSVFSHPHPPQPYETVEIHIQQEVDDKSRINPPIQLATGEYSSMGYRPPNTIAIWKPVDHNLKVPPQSEQAPFCLEKAAMAFAATLLDLDQPGTELMYLSGSKNSVWGEYEIENELYTANIGQTHDGISIRNTKAIIVFNSKHRVCYYYCNFLNPTKFAPSAPSLSPESAVALGEAAFDGTLIPSAHTSAIEVQYYIRADKTASLVYEFSVENEIKHTSFMVVLDAHTGEVVTAANLIYS
ncbi:hypothetical protein BDN70DRAFT_988164 [Pholiota conissans]|uniref:Uncharacterized protein n=1 Tax=Pholiota conissans TaxID=109636 RepID=A0A9P5ZEW4_9AGAR|nr:hypothetical protein BDN70DRAFT_988164 [Pholiota conissans]